MNSRTKSPALTRRRFVTMVAAGSAALIASPLAAATSPARKRPGAAPASGHARTGATAAHAGMSEADLKEIARQRKSTADVLAVIRKHKMAPGTEMAGAFRPIKSSRRNG